MNLLRRVLISSPVGIRERIPKILMINFGTVHDDIKDTASLPS